MKINPLEREIKAVEEGVHARYQDDGSFLVACRSPEVCNVKSHRLTLEGLTYADGSVAIRFRCDCPSGTARPSELLACYHGAAVARWLERRNLAKWAKGTWYAHGALHDQLHGEVVERPKTKKLKGRCPVCDRFLTVEIDNSTPDVRALAASHDANCAARFEERQKASQEWLDAYERKHGKPFDLWGND